MLDNAVATLAYDIITAVFPAIMLGTLYLVTYTLLKGAE